MKRCEKSALGKNTREPSQHKKCIRQIQYHSVHPQKMNPIINLSGMVVIRGG